MFPYGFNGRVDMWIDHHPTNSEYALLLLLDGERAACGEIVKKVIECMTGSLTQKEADLLYMALSTDTGCFLYSNTDSVALRCAAELLDAGADNDRLNTIFFRKLSQARMKLEGMIYSTMTFHRDGTVAVATITEAMLNELGATEDDMKDIASIANRAVGVKIAVTMREQPDGTSKVSVRTSSDISASRICEAFGGGGHPNASGCCIRTDLVSAKEQLLRVIDEVLG